MKVLINIVRIIVGVLFIFSGLIKANDPLGLSYKMQEFFELWGMGQFNDYTLWLSILMIAFEIIAGAALLLGWRIKLIIWLLLLLTIFFTFLTGYAYLSGKFKNCGCFGDCIPITPLTSFIKDIVLTILIFFLFVHKNKITAIFPAKLTGTLLALVTIFSFGSQWYALTYLPVFDCLPFKKGNNIMQKMQMPPDAIPDSTVITFVYLKGGKEIEFTADKFPADFNADTYKYVKRVDKIVRPGKNNEPPIKGLSLSGVTDEDSTAIVLNEPYCVLLFDETFSTPVSTWQNDFAKIYTELKKKNIPVYIVTTSPEEAAKKLVATPFNNVTVFKCDYTVIRTAARTNPAMYLLKEGTIVNKWSYKRFEDALSEIDKVPALPKPGDIAAPAVGGANADSTNQK